jgi:hypothetical protein
MKFTVTGADRDTGESIEMTIEAADPDAAQEMANRKGIMVARVFRTTAIQAPAEPPPAYAPRELRQPLEQGHYRGAPVINIATPRRGSSLGVASLVLGIIAFLICWIPLVNLLGVPLSGLGLLLGLIGLIVALTRGGASIGYPIAGSAICGLALFIAISMTGALVQGINSASTALAKDAQRRNATNQTVARAPAKPAATAPDPSPAPTTAPEPKEIPDHEFNVPGVTAGGAAPVIAWAPADSPIRQGDVQVQVKSVRVGKVPLKEQFGNGGRTSKDVLLRIEIEVTNLSDTKKLDYHTWGGTSMSFGKRTALADNFGNTYRLVNFGFSTEVAGATVADSVYPGKSVRDVVVFEEPIAKAERLDLELPASNFDGTGMLRFRIPVSMIQR